MARKKKVQREIMDEMLFEKVVSKEPRKFFPKNNARLNRITKRSLRKLALESLIQKIEVEIENLKAVQQTLDDRLFLENNGSF